MVEVRQHHLLDGNRRRTVWGSDRYGVDVLVPASFQRLFEAPVVELDRGALVIADEVRPDPIDIDEQLGRLDALAERLPEPTLDGLTRCLFDELGFQGNARDYYDPDNSYLDVVLDRRRGIPISLSVLCIEVGRRAGVPLAGIGLPGHFLVRDQVDQHLYLDPFRRGARLGRDDCVSLFRRMQGIGATFVPEMLDPVDSTQILLRMLTNLRHVFIAQADRSGLIAVLRMTCGLPDLDPAVAVDATSVLTGLGRFDLAAEAAALTAQLDPEHADDHLTRAAMLRARLN